MRWVERDLLDHLAHGDRVESQRVLVAIGAGNDLVAADVDSVTCHEWAKDLGYWFANASVIDLHDSVPAASYAYVGVLGEELRAEDAVRVAVELDTVRGHPAHKLTRQLIIEVHSHVLTRHCVLETITAEVACKQRVVFMFRMVLQLSCESIPVINRAVSGD